MRKRYSEMTMAELDQELENQKNFWRNFLKLEYLSSIQIGTIINESCEYVKRHMEKVHGYSFIIDRKINSHGAHLYFMNDADEVFGVRNRVEKKIKSINKVYYYTDGYINEITYYFNDRKFSYTPLRKDIEELIEKDRKNYAARQLEDEAADEFEKKLLKSVFERRKFDHRGVNYILDDLARGTTTIVRYLNNVT